MMKPSKYTQATGPIDNDYRDYQNIGTLVPNEANLNHSRYENSEELLLNHYDYRCNHQQNRQSPAIIERNANHHTTADSLMVMCQCQPPGNIRHAGPPQRFKQYNSDQNIPQHLVGSLTRLDNASTTGSQFSLDRKTTIGLKNHHLQNSKKHQHSYTCDQNQKILQKLEMKRIRSPEVINVHRGTPTMLYDGGVGYNPNCEISGITIYDDYGFYGKDNVSGNGGSGTTGPTSSRGTLKRQQSSERANGIPTIKRRPDGDGMDSEMDDPELIFEVDQIRAAAGECPCACEHVIYSPGYTNCLQDDRFPPAPDVTRRLGTLTPLGKADTPPYYRAASATNSSSTQSSRVDLSPRHWYIIITVLLFAAAAGVGVPIALKINSGASLEERLEIAARLLQEVPLIDGHNDFPWNVRKFVHNRLKDFKFDSDLRTVSPWSTSVWSHTDLPRLKRGQVSAQFWAAYVPCDAQFKDAVQLTLEQIDLIRRLTELYTPSLTLCTSAEEIKTAHRKSQICSLIGVEGGHSLAGSLGVLRSLYHVGVRYLTLTSTCNTPWAECSNSNHPSESGGLSSFGKTVVKEMNRLGMIVDLSHVSVGTMRDALAVSKAPVIFSHSSAHALCNSSRNVPDATLRQVALNRGIVMVNFYSRFLTCKDVATVADAVAHINHIREVASVDNVGLGAGYDGINYVPQGLEDVSTYPTLFAELMATGKWTVDDLRKLAGLNFLRVMQDVEKVRDEFKKANVPPYEDVMMPRPKENNCTSGNLK